MREMDENVCAGEGVLLLVAVILFSAEIAEMWGEFIIEDVGGWGFGLWGSGRGFGHDGG